MISLFSDYEFFIKDIWTFNMIYQTVSIMACVLLCK
jgi:hypothetical protein